LVWQGEDCMIGKYEDKWDINNNLGNNGSKGCWFGKERIA